MVSPPSVNIFSPSRNPSEQQVGNIFQLSPIIIERAKLSPASQKLRKKRGFKELEGGWGSAKGAGCLAKDSSVSGDSRFSIYLHGGTYAQCSTECKTLDVEKLQTTFETYPKRKDNFKKMVDGHVSVKFPLSGYSNDSNKKGEYYY